VICTCIGLWGSLARQNIPCIETSAGRLFWASYATAHAQTFFRGVMFTLLWAEPMRRTDLTSTLISTFDPMPSFSCWLFTRIPCTQFKNNENKFVIRLKWWTRKNLCRKHKAQVTLHNDNDTITCIRALIGQKFIVIVRLKKKSLRWAILKSLSLSSNDNFIIFIVVLTLTQFFCQLSRVYNLSYRYRCVVWPGL
jgi:hypothetical protein